MKYFWSLMSRVTLGIGDPVVNKTDTVQALTEHTFSLRRQTSMNT
jgi:hypothetical protein